MSRSFHSAVVSCLFIGVLACGNCRAADDNPVLTSTGVVAGTAEQVLPAGAIIHLRANNFSSLITSLDQLIVSFVPEKALPPELQQQFTKPLPILSQLNLPWGDTASVERLGAMLGLALEKPITLSFYPASPKEGFVLTLPIKNFENLTGLLIEGMRPRKLDLNKNIYEVVGLNPDLPKNVFIVCSDDRAYICGSAGLAAMVLDSKSPRLDSSDLIKRNVAQHAKESFSALVDLSAIKPFLMEAQKAYGKLPARKVHELRSQLLSQISPAKKAEINFRLRWQCGISSVEQGLDYAEAIATTTYEVLFASLSEQLVSLDGVAMSVDVGNPTQKLRVQLYSKAIKPSPDNAQPIPMAEVREALSKIPGARDVVSITGREAKTVPCAVATKWLDLLKARFAEKNLPAEGLAKFAAYIQGSVQTQSLGCSVPWTIQTKASKAVAAENVAPKTLAEYWTSLASPTRAPLLTVMPAQAEDVIEKHYTDAAKNKVANEKHYQQYKAQNGSEAPFCNSTARCQVSANGNLKKVIYENVYTSNSGYCGYSEHEFINREILYYAKQGNYYFMQKGFGSEAPWISDLAKVQASPLAPALGKLLDQVPADAVSLHTVRFLHEVPAIVTELAKIEEVLHSELNTYLGQAQKILADTGNNKENLQTKLYDINPPMVLMALNLDAATGKFYGVLPGNLRFPRPKVVPIVSALLKDFAAQADTHGGSVSYTRVADGEYEASVSVNTDALALLIKTTVNAAFETFVKDPAGQAKLRAAVSVPGDGRINHGEVLIYNPIWEFLQKQSNPDRGALRINEGRAKPTPATKANDGNF